MSLLISYLPKVGPKFTIFLTPHLRSYCLNFSLLVIEKVNVEFEGSDNFISA
jgi:hypothetical protein